MADKYIKDLTETTTDLATGDSFIVEKADSSGTKITKLSNLWTSLVNKFVKNNLATIDAGYALDARQGKALQDSITSLNSRIDEKSWYRLLASGISVSTTKTTLGTFGNRAFSDYSLICVMAYDGGMVRSTQIIPTFIFKERTISLTWVNSINQQYWVEIGYATETTFTAQTSTSANGTTVFLYALQL